MITFESDYTEGAHPAVLARLLETNLTQLPGYGSDEITARAKEKIRAACHAPESDVYFLVGGTQTNQVVISSLLASYEGAVAADTGHIGLHEAGAIETTGHKVLPLPAHEGKLDAETVRSYLERFYADGNHEHMVFPGLVYPIRPNTGRSIPKRSSPPCMRSAKPLISPCIWTARGSATGCAVPERT